MKIASVRQNYIGEYYKIMKCYVTIIPFISKISYILSESNLCKFFTKIISTLAYSQMLEFHIERDCCMIICNKNCMQH